LPARVRSVSGTNTGCTLLALFLACSAMGDSANASGHRARLRKRLFDGGPKALLDHELVEYLLTLAIPRRDTKDQAKALVARFGGIGPLLSADADTLAREGLTEGVVGALKIAEATALRLLETRAGRSCRAGMPWATTSRRQ
jgi:DNA repair protein RadC